MNINLVSDNFLDTLLDNEIRIENGVKTTVPGKEKTILGMCFHQSLKNKVYPLEFEANVKKGSIRINPNRNSAPKRHLAGGRRGSGNEHILGTSR